MEERNKLMMTLETHNAFLIRHGYTRERSLIVYQGHYGLNDHHHTAVVCNNISIHTGQQGTMHRGCLWYVFHSRTDNDLQACICQVEECLDTWLGYPQEDMTDFFKSIRVWLFVQDTVEPGRSRIPWKVQGTLQGTDDLGRSRISLVGSEQPG